MASLEERLPLSSLESRRNLVKITASRYYNVGGQWQIAVEIHE